MEPRLNSTNFTNLSCTLDEYLFFEGRFLINRLKIEIASELNDPFKTACYPHFH